MSLINEQRQFLKSNFNSSKTPTTSDQVKGIKAPPLQSAPKEGNLIIDLPKVKDHTPYEIDVYKLLMERRSLRKYSTTPMKIEELSFILETSCMIQKILGDNIASFRPAPSGGARHPFETFLSIQRVAGIPEGYYRYLPLSHQLEQLCDALNPNTIIASVNGQSFAGDANVVFYLAVVPYRAEWRYVEKSHKVILLDLGHVAQNICLSAEIVGAGACPIASYDQDLADGLFGLDGEDVYVSYILPVGKK